MDSEKKNNSRCSAIIISKKTKTKRTCIRDAVDDETRLCQQHYKKWYEKTFKKKLPQPWNTYGLPTPPEPTLKFPKAVSKLKTKIKKGPPVCGEGGHIYVYQIEGDDPCYFKIGFTVQSVHQRLDQWPGSVLVHSWRTEFPHFAETIIHLYLYAWRCYRFVLYAENTKPNDQKRFVSTCYNNPSRSIFDDVVAANPSWLPKDIYEKIKHDQSVTPEIYVKTPKKQRYTVEKEWFKVDDYESQIKKPIVGILHGIALNRY
jgi:hypothetical protein